MPKTRATGTATRTTPLDWWAVTATIATTQQARFASSQHRYPSIDHAELIERGPTRVERRSVNTAAVPVLAVRRTDLETHTGTAEGQWLTVHALSWARYPLRQHRPGYTTPILLLLLALLCTITTFTDDNDSAGRLVALVAAAFLATGGAWLLRYRRHRFQERTWAADTEATSVAGLAAAETLLTPASPELYKTAVHSWINQHRTTTVDARLRRLRTRSSETCGSLSE
ncbi:MULTISPECIES: hypothetical protein [Rhodococcus]|uniref:hypothetical protein n=1 Tax=Rhodococcus TaxID=1827 RepID=UPI0009038728|nr:MULTISPECIES: hypothetical protein [Rhodococcus]APE12539.1 hypothetical protein BO226_24555 [Rhodococcus sp. 2G]MCF8786259.1 hypothetical protein [Rhodococcus ruber]